MERKPIRGAASPKVKKKLSLKMIIAKHYLIIILLFSFLFGILFPSVVAFQYIATVCVLAFASLLISKVLNFISSGLLKWASPKTKIDPYSIPGLNPDAAELVKYLNELKQRNDVNGSD